MTVQISNALDQLVKRLVSRLKPNAIYLFGSQARGEATLDSDYDLLVVLSDSPLPRHERETKAYDALWGLKQPADVIVLTAEEFEESQQVLTSLSSTVLREGALLYG
ncbi:nucleotidyltransferase domain-containing protein [Candidatus Leptofilum sp.]|uniref:nucleotidyltransferase domain-containing protein n=1 Tax=Candidatus Leptofilum sp. TaxID=3241576 RepID=UPI003B5B946C